MATQQLLGLIGFYIRLSRLSIDVSFQPENEFSFNFNGIITQVF